MYSALIRSTALKDKKLIKPESGMNRQLQCKPTRRHSTRLISQDSEHFLNSSLSPNLLFIWERGITNITVYCFWLVKTVLSVGWFILHWMMINPSKFSQFLWIVKPMSNSGCGMGKGLKGFFLSYAEKFPACVMAFFLGGFVSITLVFIYLSICKTQIVVHLIPHFFQCKSCIRILNIVMLIGKNIILVSKLFWVSFKTKSQRDEGKK